MGKLTNSAGSTFKARAGGGNFIPFLQGTIKGRPFTKTLEGV